MVKKRMAMRMVTIFVALIVCGIFFPDLARGLSVPKLHEDVGNVVLGEDKTTSVRITNDGDHEFKIWLALNTDAACTGDFTYEGPTMYPNSDPESRFGPGDTLDVTVTFKPSAVGVCNAWLQITPLVGNEPGVEIHFTAKGVEKPVETFIKIGDFDTRVKDRPIDEYSDSTVGEMIGECEAMAYNGGQLWRCVVRLTAELWREGRLTHQERRRLGRFALKAEIHKIKQARKTSKRSRKTSKGSGRSRFWCWWRR